MTQVPHWMLAAAATAISCFAAQTGRADDGVSPRADLYDVKAIGELPAPALGYASSREVAALQSKGGDYLGGTAVAGRVAGIFVKLAQGVFISIDHAPWHLRQSAERWVDVQFPEALRNGLAEVPALLDAGQAGVEVGDAVEIRFAHPSRTRVFPIPEVTRVISVVAKNREPFARDLQRRILARLEAEDAPLPIAPPRFDSRDGALSAWVAGGKDANR